jgi:LuxR family maltose regulon positive regulatory protein
LSTLVETHGYLTALAAEGDVAFVQRLPLLTAFVRRRPEEVEISQVRHRRAAAWFAQHYDSSRQIQHLIKAGDTNEALELIHALESAMFVAGRANEVLAWYELLPHDLPGGQQDALLRRAWAVLGRGEPQAARPLYARLEGLVRGSRNETTPRMQAEVSLLGAALAGSAADPRALLDHSTRAVQLFNEDWNGNGPQYAALLRVRGLLWNGRFQEAQEVLDDVAPRLDASEYLTGLVAEQLAGAVALALGHPRKALTRGEAAVAFAQREALVGRSMEAAAAHLLRGSVRVDLGDIAGAEQDLLAARETASRYGNAGHAGFAGLGLARVEMARHAAPAALAWLAQTRQLLAAECPHSLLRHHVLVTEAHVRLLIGDLVRAKQIIGSLPPSSEASLLAVRLGQLRRPGSGLSRLTELTAHDMRTELSRQVLMAEALMPVSRRQVEGILLDVAETAQSEGLLMVLLGTSQDLLHVAEEVAVRRGQDGLLELVTLATPKAGDSAVGPRVVLSQGEVQILALLPGRDSNRQLAERLSISINTVKTRLRRLYSKLGVNSRDEAIRVARARGLLD